MANQREYVAPKKTPVAAKLAAQVFFVNVPMKTMISAMKFSEPGTLIFANVNRRNKVPSRGSGDANPLKYLMFLV